MQYKTHIAHDDGQEAHAADGTHCPCSTDPLIPAVSKHGDPALGDQSLNQDKHGKGKWHKRERQVGEDGDCSGKRLLHPAEGVLAHSCQIRWALSLLVLVDGTAGSLHVSLAARRVSYRGDVAMLILESDYRACNVLGYGRSLFREVCRLP